MDSDLYKEIGKRVRQARERLGMSQDDLASMMSYKSPATISHFETGLRKIGIVDLQKLSSILGIPLEELVRGNSADIHSSAQQFMLRASEISPSSRKAVAEFLAFANAHAEVPVPIPNNISQTNSAGEAARYILEVTKCNEPPVSPHVVAERLGIPIFDWDFPNDISGIFVNETGHVCIGVNQNHPNVRQRFTIAHEIGHFIFHRTDELLIDFVHHEVIDIDVDSKQREKETKANQFAADLLMPKSWIKRDFTLNESDVALLSKKYGVSELALWTRLRVLKLMENT